MRILGVLLALGLVLAGCGGDDDGSSSLDDVEVKGATGETPSLDFTAPFSVRKTERVVVTDGDGEEVLEGSKLSIDYLAVNGKDGKEFDTSFGAATATLTLDPERIVPGFLKGLVGTKVGSRVLIAIAPADAYGPQGGIEEAGIGADDTILFLVDVISIRHPLERATGTAVTPPGGLPTVTLDASGKPTIVVPEGAAPTELVAQTLVKGSGATVTAGQTLTAHYTGAIWPGGKQFDSSWDNGSSVDFPIGVGNVIDGWDQGLVGQTVGSQVLLVIPPDLGYGAAGNTAAGISGTDTLVFVVDILDAS